MDPLQPRKPPLGTTGCGRFFGTSLGQAFPKGLLVAEVVKTTWLEHFQKVSGRLKDRLVVIRTKQGVC